MLRLCEMFEDHMVLQRDMPVPVWGESDREGETVLVRVGGKEASAAVRRGRFLAELPALPAGGPYGMQVECGRDRQNVSDVLVGEVWLAGGQSNMEMPLFAAQGAKEYLKTADFHDLRLKTVSRRSVGMDQREFGFHFIPESSDEMPWQTADACSAARFSAIGFVAGAVLRDALKVPVGIISCNYGATRIQPWVSPAAIAGHPVFAGDAERFAQRRKALGQAAEDSWALFQRDLEAMLETSGDFVEKSLEDPLYYYTADAALHWIPDYAVGDQNEPGCLYRYMLSRVIPFSMRGVWWYQGESSAVMEDCGRYRAEMEALVDDWRAAFHNDRLAFVQAQLAPYDTARRADPCDWPLVRQAQCDVCRSRDGVYLTNLTGLGEPRNIHPRWKIEAGRRMGCTALARVYGIPAPIAPEAKEIRRQGEWLRVVFDHGKGLHAEGGLQLETGDGTSFVPAEEYRTEDDCLLVRTAHPWVRYGWHCMPGDGLKNGDRIGATPFCMKEEA